MLYPAPVVVDADVLIRNVDYALRTGRPGKLLDSASRNYTLRSGVVLFAAPQIAEEAIRHLGEVAERRGVPLAQVREAWNTLIVPKVRLVPVSLEVVDDHRVAEVGALHAADVHTAALVALLADCVLASDNRKHFRPFGLPDCKEVPTDAVSSDLLSLSRFGIGAEGVMLVPKLAGAATIEGFKRVIATVGRDGAVLIALIVLGGAFLLATSEPA